MSKRCQAPGCPNVIPFSTHPGRPRKFCKTACRKRANKIKAGYTGAKRRGHKNRTVLAIDSETATNDDGSGRLTLIACSDGSYLEGDDIRTDDALEYVVNRDGELWSFYGDYDINYWLRDFSYEALDQLREENWTFWGRWKVHHIPRRIFQLWNQETGDYVRMFDVFPFVQSSYVRWLAEWELAPESVIERIYKMKQLRQHFADESADDIRAYTFDEVKYMADGVARLKERVIASGFRPSSWLGPGAVASTALRRYRVKEFYGDESEIETPADEAYFGGRVETSLVGMYPDKLYSYDLNSAYPAAMVDLPCLACSAWQWSNKWPKAGDIALIDIAWSAEPGQRWGPLPARPHPNLPLRYRSQGRGWYWFHEIEPWLDHPAYKWHLHDSAILPQRCGHRPMEFVQELYAKRQELKRKGDPSEYAYKLILNSLYGKLAQSVGTKPFRNLVWAGIITSRTRAKIGEILVSNPDDILIVATDGIYSTAPLDLELGKRLGQWDDAGIYEWADIWQPGFYFLSDEKVRSRGFTAHDLDLQDFRDAWGDMDYLGRVKVARRRSLGYRLAAWQGHTDRIGEWSEEFSFVSFDPWPRRIPDTIHESNGSHYYRTNAPHHEELGAKQVKDDAEMYAKIRAFTDYLDDGDPIGFYRD